MYVMFIIIMSFIVAYDMCYLAVLSSQNYFNHIMKKSNREGLYAVNIFVNKLCLISVCMW